MPPRRKVPGPGNIAGQSTLFDLPGITAPPVADAPRVERSDAMSYVAACAAALLRETEHGPCSMARARHVHGVRAPAGVDPRTSGAAAIALYKAGRIEPAGWHEPSPWNTCHGTHGQLWRRPTAGGAR
ncbi:MAG: hypothetical protein J0M02_03860 [Planctomycetes bacterium]|nr:hypothetical protein [Planctomycetota bacterium]